MAFTEIEGVLYDSDGTEVGIRLPDGSDYLWNQESNKWVPSTRADLEYLLERRFAHESIIAGVDREIKAVTANLEAKKKRSSSFLAQFDHFFFKAMVELAKQNFEKGKKSFIGRYGQIKLRLNPASIQPDPADKGLEALKWLKENDSNAVKTSYSILKDSISQETRNKLAADEALRKKAGFILVPEEEKATIVHGIEKDTD